MPRRARRLLWPGAFLLLTLLATACGSQSVPGTTQTPAELKYVLFASVGPIWFCDPDFYPVGRLITPDMLDARVKDIQNNAELYAAILAHNHFEGTLTTSQKQVVYGDYKQLQALRLEPDGQRYRFTYLVAPKDGRLGTSVAGTIDRTGTVQVTSRTPGASLNCPICLAESSRIATPLGEIPITQLRAGMLVWTLDASGARAAAVLQVGSVRAPGWHEVIHFVLADGRELWVSPGHPMADARPVATLTVGDDLNGSAVVRADRVPYAGSATYDLLPAGPTTTYWANGILLASTLR